MKWRTQAALVCLGVGIVVPGCAQVLGFDEPRDFEYCLNSQCEDVTWALWPMPNPSDSGLPNPSSYEADEAKGVVVDMVTKLMWRREVDGNSYDWAGAKAYCDGLTHAGHDDWRLPTRIELVSLVDFTKADPAIDTGAFPNTPSDGFWTSSAWAGYGPTVWCVSFNVGHVDFDDVASTHWVRCVR